MNRAKFLKSVAGVLLAAKALDGATIEQLLADPEPVVTLHKSATTTLDEVLRNYYLGPLREQLNQPSLLLSKLK